MIIAFDRRWLLLLAILPLVYNAILAFLNAHVAAQGFLIVALVEVSILSVVFLYVFRNGVRENQSLELAFLAVAFSTMLLVYISSGSIYVDFVRNVLVLVAFSLLGKEFSRSEVYLIYKITVLIVSLFLLLELVSLDFYVWLFEPASYFSTTRGYDISEQNELGVFGNALGFEGRFGYGVFDGPRTSSIFLEQVGLSNMLIVVAAYSVCFFRDLNLRWRITVFLLLIIGLLSNESRLAALMVTLYAIVYMFRVRASMVSLIFVVLAVVVFGLVISVLYDGVVGDSFLGRVVLGFSHLRNLNLHHYFGGGVDKLDVLWDSGYAYLICSGTVFGALFYWFYFFCKYPNVGLSSNQYYLCILLFVVFYLAVGGTAVFSSKVAYLYWLGLGCFEKRGEGCSYG